MNKIINPNTGQVYNIYSTQGKQLLKQYIIKFYNQYGGKYLAKGTSKCVFNPAIKCADGTTYDKTHVSAVMVKKDADDEMEEAKKVKIIDPGCEFTITPTGMCKLGKLDPDEESPDEFEKCGDVFTGSVYPHTDLVQIIYKNGGIPIHIVISDPTKRSIRTELVKNLYQISFGLKKFKDKGMIHGDIKKENILYNEHEHKYYIIDYGLITNSLENLLYITHTLGDRYEYWPKDVGLVTIMTALSELGFKKEFKSLTPDKIKFLFKFLESRKLLKVSTELQGKILQNVEDLLKKFNLNEANFEEFAKASFETFDVYSFGVVMDNLNITKYFPKMIASMTEEDPRKRMSIEDVHNFLIKYRDWVENKIELAQKNKQK